MCEGKTCSLRRAFTKLGAAYGVLLYRNSLLEDVGTKPALAACRREGKPPFFLPPGPRGWHTKPSCPPTGGRNGADNQYSAPYCCSLRQTARRCFLSSCYRNPYILLLISFNRFTCPSTGPVLQGSVNPARTASLSRRIPVRKDSNSDRPLVSTSLSHCSSC